MTKLLLYATIEWLRHIGWRIDQYFKGMSYTKYHGR